MLNLIGPISNDLGYGLVTLNLAKTLTKQGIEFSLTGIGPNKVPAKDSTLLQKPLSTAYNSKWPTVKIFHQYDSSMPETSKRIFFSIWELDNFTEQETKALYGVDHNLVCSNWAKGVLRKHFDGYELNGPPCSVVPLGVDSEIFYHRDRFNKDWSLKDAVKNKYTNRFVNIGKWEIRKGHDILPDLLLATDIEDFELWMFPDNPFISKSEDMEWKNSYRSKLGDRVTFFPRMDNQSEVADIIGQCDIGVFPAKAEGWNLDLVEVMAVTGNIAYCTNYSGHTEIFSRLGQNIEDTYKLEDAWDHKWFFGQGKWAKLDIEEEASRLKYRWHKTGTIDCKKFSDMVLTTFSWENSVKELLKCL